MAKVCFFPRLLNSSNLFLQNLASLLKEGGEFECVGFYDELKRKASVFDSDVFHFNWFDQCENFSSFIYRFFVLLRVILSKKRIVWTIHNIEGHDHAAAYNKILRYFLLRFSSVIHVMSKKSLEVPFLQKYLHKVVLIPHGDYLGCYPESSLDVREKMELPNDAPIVLFLGAVRPYKNVELLVKTFCDVKNSACPEAILLVCGSVKPAEYLDKLQKELEGHKGVVFYPKFVPDEEVSAFLKCAAFLVAPYSYKSALNSGTVIMAGSYSKTVVCPDIANVQDVQDESGGLYVYHYENNCEHEKNLGDMLKHALADYKSGNIAEKERRLFDYVMKNSWKNNRSKWISLYLK